LAEQAASIERNRMALNLTSVYTYANGSSFPCSTTANSLRNGYACPEHWTQLVPGDAVELGHLVSNNKSQDENLLPGLLTRLEIYINSLLPPEIICSKGYLKFNFRVRGETLCEDESAIFYLADQVIWRRIFIGELNLEAISIGGMGLIVKPKQNIAVYHDFLSKVAYHVQHRFRSEGCGFLFDL
jgi:hypothetical protein